MTSKKAFLLSLSILIIGLLPISLIYSQPWVENYINNVGKKPTNFFEMQKAFNDYWAPMHVGRDGYYLVEGIKKKAVGYKQFRRWEYNMSHKINLETGLLPQKTAQQIYDKYLESLSPSERSTSANWVSLGTSYSDGGYAGIGRLNCVAFHPSNTNIFWVGAPAGGLWRTNDGGTTWTCLTDNNNVMGVSDIIINSDYATSNTIYIATGDRDAGDNYTIGVLKSVDGGTTWNSTGLSFSQSTYDQVNRLLVDPNNNLTLLAATTDGLYKTTNGGSTWSLLTTTSFIDMEYKPGNFNTLYASTTNGVIYYSNDGGTTWTQGLNLYSNGGRRIELAVSSNQTSWVYALVAKSDDGLYGVYKSTNSGTSYTQVFSGTSKNLLGWSSTGSDTGGQGWYDLSLAASPSDANILFVGGVNTWNSTNGGTSWTLSNHWSGSGAQAVHADKHNLKYRSDGSLFECNDGGIYLSTNNGSNWTDKADGLVISQMYKLSVSKTVASEVLTGLQDNGTKLLSGGVWTDVLGGDGMECIIDYTNVSVQYGSLYYGDLNRTTNHWSSSTSITPSSAGDGAWVTPYVIDPTDHLKLYAGYADLWKSTNQGNSWTKISTMNSSNKLRAIAVAPSNTNYIYTSDPSHLWKTTNGGTGWTEITGTLPVSNSSITSIAVKSTDPNTVWVTFSQFNANRVYQTIDGGSTWTNISTGLPSIPVYSIVQNTQNTSEVQLYVGTELGVYFKKGTNNWTIFNTGLPNVLVHELDFYYNTSSPDLSKIRAATFGRGLWESNVYYESSGTTATVPTNVQASDGTYSDKIAITWSGTSGNYFQVYRSTSNNSSTASTLSSWQTSTSYDDLTATPGITYYYWVKAATDASGSNSSAFSNGDSGWRSSVTTPTNVQASDGTYTDKVLVTWSGTSGNYFMVFRSTSNNNAFATAISAWQTSTTYNDLTAVANTTYYYWVKAAADASGSLSSSFSLYDSGWRSSSTVPTNVQASDGTYSDKVLVTWSGTTGYYFRVYRNTTNNSSTATALGSWQTTMSYNDASASMYTTYYYWVKSATSSSGANASAFSTSDSGWKNGSTVPTNVQASDGTFNNKVYVTWSGTSGNYFKVYRSTTSSSSNAVALGGWQTAMNYNDYTAVANVVYYYWVKAATNSSGANTTTFSAYNTGWRSSGIKNQDFINNGNQDFTIYPNPVVKSGEFALKTSAHTNKNYEIEIIDYAGKKLKSFNKIKIENQDGFLINAPDNEGIYLIVIKNENGDYYQNKLIVN